MLAALMTVRGNLARTKKQASARVVRGPTHCTVVATGNGMLEVKGDPRMALASQVLPLYPRPCIR